MHGVCFVVEAIDIVASVATHSPHSGDESTTTSAASSCKRVVEMLLQGGSGSSGGGSGSGAMLGGFNVSKASRLAVRASLLASSGLRLVEGHYHCDLQCDSSQLGSLYGVLSKRRGTVLSDELVDGTDLFLVSALLPVVESSGFSVELLAKTAGSATAPLLSFSHWAPIPVDPFWRPTTQDERDEHGEAYLSHELDREGNLARRLIDGMRRRKGLAVEEKVVASAEKQRTLSKNK